MKNRKSMNIENILEGGSRRGSFGKPGGGKWDYKKFFPFGKRAKKLPLWETLQSLSCNECILMQFLIVF